MNNITERNHEAPGQHKNITIIVNGRPREITQRELTFLEVVRLAYPEAVISDTIVYTVTYKRGEGHKPEGEMVNGDSVRVKEGMIFNVIRTDKS